MALNDHQAKPLLDALLGRSSSGELYFRNTFRLFEFETLSFVLLSVQLGFLSKPLDLLMQR